MERTTAFGITLIFGTLMGATAQKEQYWGSYSLSIPGGSGTGNAVKLLQLPVTAPHHAQAEVVRSTVDQQREFSASQAQLIQQQIHRQSNAPQLLHQQQQQVEERNIEELKNQLKVKMAKFQAGMRPLPVSHVEEALSAAVDNQQEFAKQQAQLIEQQQQQQQLEIQHHIQQQQFALQQAHLIQQQQRQQQQQIQDKIRQQLRLTAPTQQTMEMVVAKQKAFQRQQSSLIEHQIQQQEMQQQHRLLLPQQHPLAAAAVAKQQAFSREQAALVESQIQQQQLGEQQQQQSEEKLLVKNETPAWLEEIIKKETVQ